MSAFAISEEERLMNEKPPEYSAALTRRIIQRAKAARSMSCAGALSLPKIDRFTPGPGEYVPSDKNSRKIGFKFRRSASCAVRSPSVPREDNMHYQPNYAYFEPHKYTSFISSTPRKSFYTVDKDIRASPAQYNLQTPTPVRESHLDFQRARARSQTPEVHDHVYDVDRFDALLRSRRLYKITGNAHVDVLRQAKQIMNFE